MNEFTVSKNSKPVRGNYMIYCTSVTSASGICAMSLVSIYIIEYVDIDNKPVFGVVVKVDSSRD